MMQFSFGRSHIYPGAVARIEDDGKTGAEAMISFSDGAFTVGRWSREGAAIKLDVPAYRTAKGTEIRPRVWRLEARSADEWRVASAADPADPIPG